MTCREGKGHPCRPIRRTDRQPYPRQNDAQDGGNALIALRIPRAGLDRSKVDNKRERSLRNIRQTQHPLTAHLDQPGNLARRPGDDDRPPPCQAHPIVGDEAGRVAFGMKDRENEGRFSGPGCSADKDTRPPHRHRGRVDGSVRTGHHRSADRRRSARQAPRRRRTGGSRPGWCRREPRRSGG